MNYVVTADEHVSICEILTYLGMEHTDENIYAFILRGVWRHIEYWQKTKASGMGPFKEIHPLPMGT